MPKICLMCGESFPDATTFCPKDGSALRASVQGDDLVGELIAERYLVTDLLSQGGMGAIYLARDVRLPQQFAVKVLKQQKSPDPTLVARFRQEAEAVCRINHDRVARVFDFGFMPDDRAYIIMEYVNGRNLKQLIDDRGALDPIEAARITMMAAEGIDAAHRLGIVHRDLKPENIMILDDPGGGTRVKVLDFGIAKLQNAEATEGYTQPGFIIGTPAWMSPEQIMGGAIDARSDIYSLGLVAFALLTGARPFVGETEQAEMLARITSAPRTLKEAAPQVNWPKGLQAQFDRTLAREEGERPTTAVLFAEGLLEAIGGWKHSGAERKASPSGNNQALLERPTPPSGPAHRATSDGAAPPRSRKTLVGSIVGVSLIGAIALVMMLNKGEDGASLPAATPVAPPTQIRVDSAAPPPAPRETTVVANGTPVVQQPADGGKTASPGVGRPPAPARGDKPLVATSLPQAPDAKVAAPPPQTAAPGPARNNPDLQRVIDRFNNDNSGSTAIARETVSQLDAMIGQLASGELGWALNTLGLAHFALNDKAQACNAWDRAAKLRGLSEPLQKDIDDHRLALSCRP